ncbi:hypothetical protein Tco_1208654, partial [Tanacetum coccineum]
VGLFLKGVGLPTWQDQVMPKETITATSNSFEWRQFYSSRIRFSGLKIVAKHRIPLRDQIYQSASFDQVLPKETIAVASDMCADIAKITRKRLKPGKHEHGNGRARKELGESYLKST